MGRAIHRFQEHFFVCIGGRIFLRLNVFGWTYVVMNSLIAFSAHIDTEHVLLIVGVVAASLPHLRSQHHRT